MLKKISEIEQPFRPYGELYAACFINYEGGEIPDIAPGVIVNGLIDCIHKITLRKDVFFGHDTMLLTGAHDPEKFGEERKRSNGGGPITIEEGAWIASRAIVLGPCTIGQHAVVAAGAVVTRDVEAYTMVAGNPAKVIKRYDKEKKEWKNETS